jgi:hypothetical protein
VGWGGVTPPVLSLSPTQVKVGGRCEGLSDSTNQYSITIGTAFTNIYWNGTAYELENRTGLTLSYYLSFLGN